MPDIIKGKKLRAAHGQGYHWCISEYYVHGASADDIVSTFEKANVFLENDAREAWEGGVSAALATIKLFTSRKKA